MPSFRKGLSLDLKLEHFSLTKAKSVAFDLEDFTKQLTLSFN